MWLDFALFDVVVRIGREPSRILRFLGQLSLLHVLPAIGHHLITVVLRLLHRRDAVVYIFLASFFLEAWPLIIDLTT